MKEFSFFSSSYSHILYSIESIVNYYVLRWTPLSFEIRHDLWSDGSKVLKQWCLLSYCHFNFLLRSVFISLTHSLRCCSTRFFHIWLLFLMDNYVCSRECIWVFMSNFIQCLMRNDIMIWFWNLLITRQRNVIFRLFFFFKKKLINLTLIIYLLRQFDK